MGWVREGRRVRSQSLARVLVSLSLREAPCGHADRPGRVEVETARPTRRFLKSLKREKMRV